MTDDQEAKMIVDDARGPMLKAAEALWRHTNERIAKMMRPDEAEAVRSERWEDTPVQARAAMVEMARVVVDAHRTASGTSRS